jgi:hypothetical protein
VGLVVVELLEETLPPVSVFVEEEEEVFEVDLLFSYSLGEVLVHEVENVNLLIAHYLNLSLTDYLDLFHRVPRTQPLATHTSPHLYFYQPQQKSQYHPRPSSEPLPSRHSATSLLFSLLGIFFLNDGKNVMGIKLEPICSQASAPEAVTETSLQCVFGGKQQLKFSPHGQSPQALLADGPARVRDAPSLSL